MVVLFCSDDLWALAAFELAANHQLNIILLQLQLAVQHKQHALVVHTATSNNCWKWGVEGEIRKQIVAYWYCLFFERIPPRANTILLSGFGSFVRFQICRENHTRITKRLPAVAVQHTTRICWIDSNNRRSGGWNQEKLRSQSCPLCEGGFHSANLSWHFTLSLSLSADGCAFSTLEVAGDYLFKISRPRHCDFTTQHKTFLICTHNNTRRSAGS